ncbi:MAG: SH3 domain-containing protein [Nitrospinae bacterium]|nr:SH3 domain-containing protein [Nitrospinota bacterium]MBL7020989.1 SH3 domain-containing protein [Nitrospinaceae bacterium]
MFDSPLMRVLLIILLFGMVGCATGPVPVNPYFEMPPERLPKAELELYNRALEQLKNNQIDNSIELWQRFLKNNPRSFRGYNNLGMALYSNDQLKSSMEAFETALALEPFDRKIKDNLKRALKFQVTILRENKDYATAIKHLERVKKLTDLAEKEKVALEIETLQDLIYEQVKRANTLEAYEEFLAKYPDNPKNSDEARRLIAKMKPQEPSMGEFPEMQGERLPDPAQRTTSSGQGTVVPEPMQSVPTLPPVRRETIEIVAETVQADEAEDLSSDTQDIVMEEAKPSPKRQPPVEPVAVDPDIEMKRERPTPPTQKPAAAKWVKVVTLKAPLRVRAAPDAKSKVLAQLPKNTVVPVFQEAKDWFQVEYQKGKKGWISRKYSQLVN